MPFKTLLLMAAAHLATAAPASPTCSTVTKTASFDNLPTGTLTQHEGLAYEGWEVVKATDTPFTSSSSSPSYKNILRTTGEKGIIRSADATKLFNDQFTHAFLFGCANSTGAQGCDINKLYGVPCNYFGCSDPGPSFDLLFDVEHNPHTLELAGGFEYTNTPNITWSVHRSDAVDAPPDFNLYIDEYTYYITDCQ